MAITATDVSVAINGDIRWTGNATQQYTWLELHRFVGQLADDQQASGNDLIDITSDTPSDRSTNRIFALQGAFNIDDEMAEHFFDGSLSQSNGDTLYSGLVIVGTAPAGTELQIIQDDVVLTPHWGTGINPDAANNIIMRVSVKTREGGADIDGKRLRVRAGELGDTYAEFNVTAGLGNSTAAIFTAADLNNATAEATIAGFTSITNVEGFQLIDITGDGTDEEYYSQFNIGTQTVNDTFERAKWIQKRSTTVDSNTETGNDFIVDNATILAQGHEFSATATNAEKLVSCTFRLKINAGTPTGDMFAELYLSDDATPGIPTGGTLATSQAINTTRLTSGYLEYQFMFYDNISLTPGEDYFIVITHPDGAAGDNVHVEGDTTSADNGTRAELTGVWTGSAGQALNFKAFTSPTHHERAGDLFRGITHEIIYDNELVANFNEDEIVFWGTQVTYDNIASGPFVVGDYCTFEPVGGGTVKVGGKIVKQTATVLHVALDDISGSLVANNDIIRVVGKATTADVNVTITDDDRAGGEGLLLALDDNGTAGDLYIQLISGSAPVDNLIMEGRTSGATALVNVTINSRTISASFIGVSTGTNIIGAYGIGFEAADVTSSDQFFDLTNTLRVPPNNVTFTVTGLVSGEDYVLVGPRLAGVLDKPQMTLAITLSGAAETIINVGAANIPTETPSTGPIRVQLDTGIYRRVVYTSNDGDDEFTTASTSWTGVNVATTPRDVFLSYIDLLATATSEAYTAVYTADRDLLVRVRDGGATPIKTFESPATFGSSNTSVPAIRTSDA